MSGEMTFILVSLETNHNAKYELTATIEITKSKDEAKQLYSQAVINKVNDECIAYTALRHNIPEGDSWYGNKGPLMAQIEYLKDFPTAPNAIASNGTWVVTMQTVGV